MLIRLAVIALASACATTAPQQKPAALAVPSPLDGPGRPQISRHEADRIAKGWSALERSDFATAAEEAVRAGRSPQAQLLGMQVRLLDEPSPDLVQELTDLAQRHNGYASAWITLSVAAQRVGDERTALEAAREGSELWPSGPFSNRAFNLEELWITDRIARANIDLENSDLGAARSEIDAVLALEPDSQPALLASARVEIGLGENGAAEETLARLGDQPEALMMRAQIAYNERQWNRSMDLLSRTPEGYPGREEALRRARLRWRLSILPQYVQDAVSSQALTREQLAVLLVALTPSLETMPGGRTPLMQDVLRLPSQRSILTVTRLGIMVPDGLENRFYPNRTVTVEQVRDAIEATSHLVGLSPPIWCGPENEERDGCTLLEEPMTGSAVTEVLLRYVVEDSEA